MLPVPPYNPGRYPPPGNFPHFDDRILEDSTNTAQETWSKLAQKRGGMMPFHIDRLQRAGLVPMTSLRHGGIAPHVARDPAEQGVRAFDRPQTFNIGGEDWDEHVPMRYRDPHTGLEDPEDYNPHRNPFHRGRMQYAPGLPATTETQKFFSPEDLKRNPPSQLEPEEPQQVVPTPGTLGGIKSGIKSGFRHARPVAEGLGVAGGVAMVGLGYAAGGLASLAYHGTRVGAGIVGNVLNPYSKGGGEEDEPSSGSGESSKNSRGSGAASSGATGSGTSSGASSGNNPEKEEPVPYFLLDRKEREEAARKTPEAFRHLGKFANRSIDARKLARHPWPQ